MALPPEPLPAAAKRGDAYNFEQQLGCGANGAVWRASRRDDEEQVGLCVKVVYNVQAGLRTNELSRRYETEFRLLEDQTRLPVHENIIRVFDHFNDDPIRLGLPDWREMKKAQDSRQNPSLAAGLATENNLFIVMELMDTDLHKLSNARRAANQVCPFFSDLELLVIIEQVSCALCHLKQHKIVHRDIKPDNILVRGALNRRNSGQVKLGDFGEHWDAFAFAESEGSGFVMKNSGQTPGGRGAGGALYALAPEVRLALQDRRDVDYLHNDIWALGHSVWTAAGPGDDSPFPGSHRDLSLFAQAYYEDLPDCYGQQLRPLVHDILMPDPAQRLPCEQAVIWARECIDAEISQATSPQFASARVDDALTPVSDKESAPQQLPSEIGAPVMEEQQQQQEIRTLSPASTTATAKEDSQCVVMMYDFVPSDLDTLEDGSPVASLKMLPLKVGNKVKVLSSDGSEWFYGHVVGQSETVGYFPAQLSITMPEYYELMRQYDLMGGAEAAAAEAAASIPLQPVTTEEPVEPQHESTVQFALPLEECVEVPDAQPAAHEAQLAAPDAQPAGPGPRPASPGAQLAAPGPRPASPGARPAAHGPRPASPGGQLAVPSSQPVVKLPTVPSRELAVQISDLSVQHLESSQLLASSSTATWGIARRCGHGHSAPEHLEGCFVQHIYSTYTAFAALLSTGAVVTWGGPASGGDSSTVRKELSSGVREVFSTYTAFAALKNDGSVVTWGAPGRGGDSSAKHKALSSGVKHVFATSAAFAALKIAGEVVTWGDAGYGSDSRGVHAELKGYVKCVFSSSSAFAALKKDGSVVSWDGTGSGDCTKEVQEELSGDVQFVFSTASAFAALKSSGAVVTWGVGQFGGDSSAVRQQLQRDVVHIFSTYTAFAALKADGTVVTWGAAGRGGDSRAVQEQLVGVSHIYSTDTAFAAVRNDGSVVTWGAAQFGGDSSAVEDELAGDVQAIYSTCTAFAAVKSDGSVVTWGDALRGGDSSAVWEHLQCDVMRIYATETAFAALKADGSVVTWGAEQYGGDSGAVQGQLESEVVRIYSTDTAFAAVKANGSVVTWGAADRGGDSSGVQVRLARLCRTASSRSSSRPGTRESASRSRPL